MYTCVWNFSVYHRRRVWCLPAVHLFWRLAIFWSAESKCWDWECKIERLSNGIRFYQPFLRLSSRTETTGLFLLFCSHQTQHTMAATLLTSQFNIIPIAKPHIWNAWPLLMGIMRNLTILAQIPIPQLAQMLCASPHKNIKIPKLNKIVVFLPECKIWTSSEYEIYCRYIADLCAFKHQYKSK